MLPPEVPLFVLPRGSRYYLTVLTGTISSFCKEIVTGQHSKRLPDGEQKKLNLLMHSDTENKYKDVTNEEQLHAIACSVGCTFGYRLEEQV